VSGGGDARLHAPATLRNREPLAGVLDGLLGRGAAGGPAPVLLEVAAGSGEHAAFFAARYPAWEWWPSDPSAEARASIAAWTAGLPNVRPPLALDAAAGPFPTGPLDAVLCVNMAHIAPWAATEGLVRGAGAALRAGAPLVLYGPWLRAGVETAASNLAFDADLRARDGRWGLRSLDALAAVGAAAGFGPPAVTELPANNVAVVLRAGAQPSSSR
jgi:hypothetical protein